MADIQRFHQDLNAALAIVFQDAEDRFELDRNGMVTIVFEGDAEVVLQAVPDSDTVLLTADICSIDRDDTARLRRALEANLFNLVPTGAFLAYDAERALLALCQSAGPQMCQPQGLADCLTAFVAGIANARGRMLMPAEGTVGNIPFAPDVSDIIISG